MKVLLVQHAKSSNRVFPLGLGYVAAVLMRSGHGVSFINLGFEENNEETLIEKLKTTGSKAIGLTVMTSNYQEALRMVTRMRRELPGVRVVMGGPHAAARAEEILRDGAADVAVTSEGEINSPLLFDVLGKGGDLSSVPGIAFLDKQGRCVRTPSPPATDLDSIPSPPWETFELRRHCEKLRGKRAVSVLTSRGCPHRCVFCNRGPSSSHRYRLRSVENIIREIDELNHSCGIDAVNFRDDIFTNNMGHTKELCRQMASRKQGLIWKCQTRVDRVNAELLGWMKRAGCIRVSFGVESGSERILEKMRKGVNKEQIRQAFAYCREAGMPSTAYFMIGTPWETQETIEETISFARELRSTSSFFFIATPYPDTELEREFLKAGWDLPGDYESFVHSRGLFGEDEEPCGKLNPRQAYFLAECRRAVRKVLFSRLIDVRGYPHLVRSYFTAQSPDEFMYHSARVSRGLLSSTLSALRARGFR